jgi:hypothetical protein
MEPRRVMKLHDKTGARHLATVPPAIRRPRPGVAARTGRLSVGKVTVQCRRPGPWPVQNRRRAVLLTPGPCGLRQLPASFSEPSPLQRP